MERQRQHRGATWVGLRVLVLGVVFQLGNKFAAAQGTGEDPGFMSPTKKCWVFAQMNKSGSSTIKRMLNPWIQKHNNVSLGLYDNREWAMGMEYAQTFVETGNTIVWGGYTEGLRRYGAQDCKWFTMFRQ